MIILHGTRRWYDRKGILRQNGHRFSRHYYDVYQLLNSPVGQEAKNMFDLAANCVRHARMFFNSPSLDLKNAQPGTFAIEPSEAMLPTLKRDYQGMRGMIFGEAPDFSAIVDCIRSLASELNKSYVC